jgi:mRNA-degrading endonuclease YafQ of YafQ-DinJ toxin-antitoxin module
MQVNINLSEYFKKDLKILVKKYKSIKNDINNLISDLEKNPYLGIEL